MTSRTAAARYARALRDVATKESVDLEAAGRELDEFIAFFSQQPELHRLLLNPAVPTPRKRAAMEQVIALSGFTPIVSKLLILLADRDRLSLLADLSKTYHEMLAERQNVVRADVTSAEPLSQGQVDAIEKKLTAITGRRVTVRTKVDVDLIGGMIARVAGTVYDASVATQLRKMRERLTAS